MDYSAHAVWDIHVCRSVTLHNRSKVVVHYQWKAFSAEEEEEQQKQL